MGIFGPPNIEKMKAKRDIKGLINALRYREDGKVRETAAEALGQIGDVRAIEPLIAALKRGSSNMRKEVVCALVKIGTAAVGPLIATLNFGIYNVRKEAEGALVKIGTAAIGPLITALKGGNGNVRKEAEGTLVKIGTAAVEPLIAALNDDLWYVRISAVRALGEIRDSRAVIPLIAKAKANFSTESERHEAQVALEKIGDPRALDVLAGMLINTLRNDPFRRSSGIQNWEFGIKAAEALGRIKDPRAIESLLNVAIHETFFHELRVAALEALVEIGEGHIVRRVLDWLECNDQTTVKCIDAAKRIIIEMIMRKGDRIAPDDLRAVATVRDMTRVVTEAQRNPVTDDYERIDWNLKVDNSQLRRIATKELTRRGLKE